MKTRNILSLLLCLAVLLSGCGSLLESEYISVTPHTEQHQTEDDEDILTAENYLSLENAILSFVENGVTDGVIRIYDYSGNLESDLEKATYTISTNDPLGAYAVDTITYDCSLIVSYYEIHIRTEFRRSLEQIQAIQPVANGNALETQIAESMSNYDSALTVRISYYNGQDAAQIAEDYYRAHPATAMEMPHVTVNIYPDGGYVRIIEILFDYSLEAEELLSRQDAVETSARAAQEYIRYRETETDKLQLLYTYLQERFTYTTGTTTTPVYSFLCEGIVDSVGSARSLQALCDEAGLECYTVEGSHLGEPYTWNIVCVDGVYCHTDLFRSLISGNDSLTLFKDASMGNYTWDAAMYPPCP